MSATLDVETKQEICKIASKYYSGKGLTQGQFSNRIYSIERYIAGHWEMRDCLEFLVEKENIKDNQNQTKLEARIRYQLKYLVDKVLKEMPSLASLRGAFA